MLVQLLRDGPDHERIISVDESCQQLSPGALKTWAKTSSQNVQLAVNGNEKDSFTVVAAVTAARTKLPLFITAAGKTEMVEGSHFGDVGQHRTTHSDSGRQTTEAFTEWLSLFRGVYDDGNSI
jgi:hypothetical protein